MQKFILLILVSIVIASCGIKGHLDTPPDAKYKRTYPSY